MCVERYYESTLYCESSSYYNACNITDYCQMLQKHALQEITASTFCINNVFVYLKGISVIASGIQNL